MTISNCDISGNTAAFGAGVGNGGTLTVVGSHIFGNSASAGGTGVGGGIWTRGTMTISQCTLDNNQAPGNGGGIYNYIFGNLTISQCTLSNNVSNAGSGGGIYNGSRMTVSGSTLYAGGSMSTGAS
jgi:parallel beta-helix repeat protein